MINSLFNIIIENLYKQIILLQMYKKSNKNTYKLIKYLFVNTKAQKPKEEIEIAEEDIKTI